MEPDDEGFYGSASATSTSIDDDSYQFVTECGHEYYDPPDTLHKPLLPCDEKEKIRLDLQHRVFRADVLFEAPIIPENMVYNVLYLGTGAGRWAIEFAESFPISNVQGWDMTPMQPNYVPRNCNFYIDTIEKGLGISEKFDYIRGSHLQFSVRDWQSLLESVHEALTPGGYVEFSNIQFPIAACGAKVLRDWQDLVERGAESSGVNLRSCNDEMKISLESVGFGEIHSTTTTKDSTELLKSSVEPFCIRPLLALG